VFTEQGKLEQAERYYRKTIETAHEPDLRDLEDVRTLEALALANLANNLLRQGKLTEAQRRAEESVALGRTLENKRNLVFALATLGQMYLRMARLDDARRALEEGQAVNEKVGWIAAPIRQHLAELAFAEGQLDNAETLARQTVEDYRSKKMNIGEFYALTVYARVLFRRGKTAAGQQATEQERALAQEIGFDHVREEIAVTLALARAARGDTAGALEELQGAIARSQKHGFVDASLEQRLVQAELEVRGGARGKARRHLAALRRDAEDRGYQQLLRDVAGLERQLR
jgi:tetratricopeptide (TPR) repeat protein